MKAQRAPAQPGWFIENTYCKEIYLENRSSVHGPPARRLPNRSDGVFLGAQNLRGMLGLLPEMGLVLFGPTMLMICG